MEAEKPEDVETPKEYQRRLMKTRSKLIYKMWKEEEDIPEVAEAVIKEKQHLNGELGDECGQSEDEGDHRVSESLDKKYFGPSEQQK